MDEHGEYAPLLLAQLRPWHVDRFIAERRSEWAIAPRDATVAEDGTVLMPGRPGRCVSDHTISKEVVALRAAPSSRAGRGCSTEIQGDLPTRFRARVRATQALLDS